MPDAGDVRTDPRPPPLPRPWQRPAPPDLAAGYGWLAQVNAELPPGANVSRRWFLRRDTSASVTEKRSPRQNTVALLLATTETKSRRPAAASAPAPATPDAGHTTMPHPAAAAPHHGPLSTAGASLQPPNSISEAEEGGDQADQLMGGLHDGSAEQQALPAAPAATAASKPKPTPRLLRLDKYDKDAPVSTSVLVKLECTLRACRGDTNMSFVVVLGDKVTNVDASITRSGPIHVQSHSLRPEALLKNLAQLEASSGQTDEHVDWTCSCNTHSTTGQSACPAVSALRGRLRDFGHGRQPATIGINMSSELVQHGKLAWSVVDTAAQQGTQVFIVTAGKRHKPAASDSKILTYHMKCRSAGPRFSRCGHVDVVCKHRRQVEDQYSDVAVHRVDKDQARRVQQVPLTCDNEDFRAVNDKHASRGRSVNLFLEADEHGHRPRGEPDQLHIWVGRNLNKGEIPEATGHQPPSCKCPTPAAHQAVPYLICGVGSAAVIKVMACTVCNADVTDVSTAYSLWLGAPPHGRSGPVGYGVTLGLCREFLLTSPQGSNMAALHDSVCRTVADMRSSAAGRSHASVFDMHGEMHFTLDRLRGLVYPALAAGRVNQELRGTCCAKRHEDGKIRHIMVDALFAGHDGKLIPEECVGLDGGAYNTAVILI